MRLATAFVCEPWVALSSVQFSLAADFESWQGFASNFFAPCFLQRQQQLASLVTTGLTTTLGAHQPWIRLLAGMALAASTRLCLLEKGLCWLISTSNSSPSTKQCSQKRALFMAISFLHFSAVGLFFFMTCSALKRRAPALSNNKGPAPVPQMAHKMLSTLLTSAAAWIITPASFCASPHCCSFSAFSFSTPGFGHQPLERLARALERQRRCLWQQHAPAPSGTQAGGPRPALALSSASSALCSSKAEQVMRAAHPLPLALPWRAGDRDFKSKQPRAGHSSACCHKHDAS